MHSIEEGLFQQIKHSLRNDKLSAMLAEICQAIYDNRDLCRILFSDNGNKDFLRDMIYSAREKSVLEWESAGLKAGPEQTELMFSYFANGSIAVIRGWILQDLHKTPEEMAQFILALSSHGLAGFTQQVQHR